MRDFPLVLADFSGIGGEIASGAAHAIWGIISAVPLAVWLILFVAICAIIAVMRVVTNWKVDAVLIVIAAIIALAIYFRQHYINIGYAEAQAQVKAAQVREAGYKATEKLIIDCYAKDTMALTYIWDRTDGTCKRVDGGQ